MKTKKNGQWQGREKNTPYPPVTPVKCTDHNNDERGKISPKHAIVTLTSWSNQQPSS